MNIALLFHTLLHLKYQQLYYQILNRVRRKLRIQLVFKGVPSIKYHISLIELQPFILKYKCYDGSSFTFLNISSPFKGWNYTNNGMLWAYNLNYFDWLLQDGISYQDGKYWINQFIADLPKNNIGLDPYPISLRGINWIKFVTLHKAEIDETTMCKWNHLLFAQYNILSRNLEYHLLGNHLLENAFYLFIASIYFNNISFYKKSTELLRKELNEQILSDGAHYEQSPMYHCIMLDRLLDCINVCQNNIRFEGQQEYVNFLIGKVELMLGHLKNIIYSDYSIPLLNDSVYEIAPTPRSLFDYAERLGIKSKNVVLKECGYRKLCNRCFESIIDVGNITASYQSGHSHADTFNFELRINGKPFIVDTGISTYNKTKRRQYERSTVAHNTVTVNDKDSSEVWGGFRIGNRAKVHILLDSPNRVEAYHNGYGKIIHKRTFCIDDFQYIIKDEVNSEILSKSYIHFAPSAKVIGYSNKEIKFKDSTINLEGAYKVDIIKGTVSVKYNIFDKIDIAVIYFKRVLTYYINVN